MGSLAAATRESLRRLLRREAAALPDQAVPEQQIYAVLDALTEATFVLDSTSRRVVYANQGAARLYGCPREELLGRDSNALGYAADPADLGNLRRRAVLEKSQSISLPGRMCALDGGELPVEVQVTFPPGLASAQRYIVVVRDVSAREAAESARAATEGRLQHLLAVSPFRLFVARRDQDGWTMVYCSKAAGPFGCPPEERTDFRTWFERIHAEDRLAVLDALDRTLATGRHSLDHRVVVDGVTEWVHAKLVRSEGYGRSPQPEIIGTWMEISDRVESEAATRSVVQSLADCVIMLDAAGHILSANAAVERTFGYPADELIGRPFVMLAGGDDALRHGPFVGSYLVGQRPRIVERAHEIHATTRAGERRIVELTAREVTSGGEKAFTCILRDVTARRMTEGALRASEERWRSALSDLERAKTDAEKANRAKSAFLATMSHEIRTPMNGVLGMLDVLARHDLGGEVGEIVETARVSATALLRVLDDILDFSRIEADRLTIFREPTPVAEVVFGVAETMLPHALEQQVRLRAFSDPRLPSSFDTDAVRLRQILYNLIGNAIKFSRGSVESEGLVVARADALVDANGYVVGVAFEVRDDGIGIDPAALPRLFRAFEQGEASTTRRFGGTGLGLSITKRLVELLGGHITVESVVGQGTSFRVNFPIERTHQREPDGVLGGLVVILDADEPRRRADVAALLHHAGVSQVVDPASEFAAVLARGDASVAAIRVVVRRRAEPADLAQSRLPSVLLVDGEKRKPQRIAASVVALDASILRADVLVEAIMMALGWTRAGVERDSPHDAELPDKDIVQAQAFPAAWGPVLVAEDNPINQKVILRQLAMLGIAAELAADGREALQSWRTKHHRFVFTDIHMPAMDGYELARCIRREERANGSTCIVAISANVIGDGPVESADADFDLRVAKPVQLRSLEAAIRFLVQQRSGQASSDESTEFSLDTLRALLGDDDRLLGQLLVEFVEDAQATTRSMRSSAECLDLPDVGRLGHRMKSSARSIGAHAFGDLCEHLEKVAKGGDPQAVERALKELLLDWEILERSIQMAARRLGHDDG